MSGRIVPYDEDIICDRCGKSGAYDFMGDCYCDDCLDTDADGNVVVKPYDIGRQYKPVDELRKAYERAHGVND